jgi:hypothetical protein
MKKHFALLFIMLVYFSFLHAQDEEKKEKGFKKEKLFTGGSISLSFFNNTFLIGGSPVFGYSLTKWADVGIVVNYNYTSYRDYPAFNDRLRQTLYGGGVFARLFPVRFIFVQAQAEHNFIRLKYIPAGIGTSYTTNIDANSLLVGGGYTTGRWPGNNNFFYVAVLFDVSGNSNSPYTDAYGRKIPIIRAGVNIALFQGKNKPG